MAQLIDAAMASLGAAGPRRRLGGRAVAALAMFEKFNSDLAEVPKHVEDGQVALEHLHREALARGPPLVEELVRQFVMSPHVADCLGGGGRACAGARGRSWCWADSPGSKTAVCSADAHSCKDIGAAPWWGPGLRAWRPDGRHWRVERTGPPTPLSWSAPPGMSSPRAPMAWGLAGPPPHSRRTPTPAMEARATAVQRLGLGRLALGGGKVRSEK